MPSYRPPFVNIDGLSEFSQFILVDLIGRAKIWAHRPWLHLCVDPWMLRLLHLCLLSPIDLTSFFLYGGSICKLNINVFRDTIYIPSQVRIYLTAEVRNFTNRFAWFLRCIFLIVCATIPQSKYKHEPDDDDWTIIRNQHSLFFSFFYDR